MYLVYGKTGVYPTEESITIQVPIMYRSIPRAKYQAMTTVNDTQAFFTAKNDPSTLIRSIFKTLRLILKSDLTRRDI